MKIWTNKIGGSLVSAQNQQTEEDWSIQEKKFDLEQHKAGAELRVREGRGKPLDIVYFYMGKKIESKQIKKKRPKEIISNIF